MNQELESGQTPTHMELRSHTLAVPMQCFNVQTVLNTKRLYSVAAGIKLGILHYWITVKVFWSCDTNIRALTFSRLLQDIAETAFDNWTTSK